MGFSLGGGIENTDTNVNEAGTSDKTTTGTGTTTTSNSGSTNTGKSVTNGTTSTDASINSTYNSGSTNVTTSGPTSSNTYNSGRVDTSQLMLSEDAVNHLVQGMLEGTNGTQGLAAVTSGQNRSGAYNTTVGELLTNDLVSRVAGDVAARSAVTKTTIGSSTSATQNSGQTTTQNIGNSYGQTNIGATNTHNTSETDVNNIIGPSSSTVVSDMLENTTAATTASKDTSATKEDANAKWILCTELRKQNRMPMRFYSYGLREFNSYEEQSKKGYYIWAVPALKHLRNKPFSLLSKVMCKLLNARAEQIAAKYGCKGARKTLLGAFSVNLYWGCWILSRTIARDYQYPLIQGESYVI